MPRGSGKAKYRTDWYPDDSEPTPPVPGRIVVSVYPGREFKRRCQLERTGDYSGH